MKNAAYLKRLRIDLERWVAAGLIDASLSARLYADAKSNSSADQSSPILPGLAGLIIILGLLTIIAANWAELSGLSRLLIFFGLFSASIFGAGELRARNLNLASNLCAAIAAALAGGGLVVIGQLYHTGATTSGFLATWTLLALTVSVLLRSPLALALTSALCLLWMWSHFSEIGYWRIDGRIIYAPIWALPVWFAVSLWARLTKTLALVHLAFIGVAAWITPTIFDLLPFEPREYTFRMLASASVWLLIGTGFEMLARGREIWATRTLAGWSTWLASFYLVVAAVGDRFQSKYFGEFGLPLLALVLFSALTAYGAAPGRRWLRGAGVAGFIAVSLIFFTAARDLLVSGLIMVAFGVALIVLLMATNRMLARARAAEMQTSGGGA